MGDELVLGHLFGIFDCVLSSRTQERNLKGTVQLIDLLCGDSLAADNYLSGRFRQMRLALKSTRLRVGYLWLCALGIALAFSALTTDRRMRQVEEFAAFSDPFAYLQSAQDIRQAAASHASPRFEIDSQHNRQLIALMQSRGLPSSHWDEMIAPLGYHYFPRSGTVGPIVTPGTGMLLSLFPQGKALHRLNRTVIGLFLVTAAVTLIVAAQKQAWLSAGFVILALHLGLEVLARIDNASFSINALFAPLLLSGLCLAIAGGFKKTGVKFGWTISLLALIGGLLFGLAILVRMPVILLMPGLLALLWPTEWQDGYKSTLATFLIGAFFGGVLPLLVYQSHLTGAWYLPTYGRGDYGLPSLEVLRSNFSFYFGPGKPSEYNWALLVIVIGCVGLWLNQRKALGASKVSSRYGSAWGRLIISASIMWILPTAYFLTHRVTGHYYPVPALFGTVLLLALGAFGLEPHQSAGEDRRNSRRLFRMIGLLLALTPGLIVIERVWSHYEPATAESAARQVMLPAELVDERAWVWAFDLSGAFWYYARKPAHKINFAGPDARLLLYEFVSQRGEPQYIVNDNSDMQRMQDEIVQLGGALEPRGKINGYPYFLIHWPPNGPGKKEGASSNSLRTQSAK